MPRRGTRTGGLGARGEGVTGSCAPSASASTPSRARGSTRRGDTMSQRARYDDPRLVREPMAVVEGDQNQSVLALLTRMRASAFQGRQLGEAFETWKRMIEGPSLICLGYAASLSSAGL